MPASITPEAQRWTIGDHEFALFQELIHRETGIALKETKRPLLVSRLGRRLRELSLDSFEAYHRLLTHSDASGAELRHMINCITTNKTSFFREEDHFHFLADHLRAWVRANGRPFRIWSAACSTGEEPYSIALTALEALGPAARDRVQILASDIDTDVLDRAAAGLYEEQRGEALPEALRRKYFLRGTGRWAGTMKVKPEVRGMVRFQRLNLVETDWPLRDRFEAIFCRNVIIYFDRETQRALFAHLLDRLTADGLLFIGHSESLQWITDRVRPVRHTVYRHNQGGER